MSRIVGYVDARIDWDRQESLVSIRNCALRGSLQVTVYVDGGYVVKHTLREDDNCCACGSYKHYVCPHGHIAPCGADRRLWCIQCAAQDR